MMTSLKELGIGICLGGSLALTGCGQKTVAPSLAELNCPEIQGAEALLTREGIDLIVFGELHGMVESPQFVADMICHDLKLHGRSVLALEKSKDMRADLDVYLSEKDEGKARNAFLKLKSWNGNMQDGRSSIAMFELMKSVKNYRQLGYDVSISLFISGNEKQIFQQDVPMHVNAQNHEQDMADNLVHAVQVFRESGKGHVIALVGSLHARRGRAEFYDEPYDFMMNLMPQKTTLALASNYTAGTAWNCRGTGNGPSVCAIHTRGDHYDDEIFMKNGKLVKSREIHIFEETNERGYDGYFYVGKSTASPPAHTLITD